MRQAWPAHPEVPISKAVRAGDFVFTSAYGPWTFDPAKVVFDDAGDIVDDGSGLRGHAVRGAGAPDRGLRRGGARRLPAARCDDVVKCECWLADARDFVAFNRDLPHLLHPGPAGALGLPVRFMFACKIEMQAVAYRPVSGG